MARRGGRGVTCLLPDCPGGVVSKRLQAPCSPREGKAPPASLGGGRGGRVKRKHGFDFPDKAAAAAPSHLPAQRMSPGYLQVVCTCGAAGGSCGRGAAASHLPRVRVRVPSRPVPPAPLRDAGCAGEGGEARGLLLRLPPWRLRGLRHRDRGRLKRLQVRVSSAFALGCHSWRGRAGFGGASRLAEPA